MRKAFEVIINNKPYDVWDINEKEHGGWNGEPKTWWVYYADRLPEGLTPPLDSENWEPYSKSINRLLWDINYKQWNTSKYKWDNTDFRNGGHCEMRCNGKLVYSFHSGTVEYALSKANYLTTHLLEGSPFNFLDPHSENGRKIWWKGLPATVKVWRQDEPWLIGVIPDYTTGFSKGEWWEEYAKRNVKLLSPYKKHKGEDWEEEDDNEELGESMGSDFINWGDVLSDKYIDWFRK